MKVDWGFFGYMMLCAAVAGFYVAGFVLTCCLVSGWWLLLWIPAGILTMLLMAMS